MISNYRQLRYAILFGKGKKPAIGEDLVKSKIDADIEISHGDILEVHKLLFEYK